jgi:prephenate dehydrogenase
MKEHPREVLLIHLPKECSIICTHPMLGPNSGANGWHNLNFVDKKTRVDKVIFDHIAPLDTSSNHNDTFVDTLGT